MKNRKWLTYLLGVLLTLVILAAVGGAGFRIGRMQNTSFERPAFAQPFGGASWSMQKNFRGNGGPQAMQGNPHNQGFDNRGDNRRGGGMPFFSPIFGLIRLIVLGLLLWIVYKFVKNSGWRLTRVQASPAPTPSAAETPNVEVVEKKETE
jgi:uncharacterized membrane protein